MPGNSDYIEPEDIGAELARMRRLKEQAVLTKAHKAMVATDLAGTLAQLNREIAQLRQQIEQLDESS